MNAEIGNLLWLDLEMTGLDPDRERIIEIATLVTNKNLDILAEGPEFVIHQSDELLDAMDAWNKKQHNKTGLAEKVRQSQISTEQAETVTLEFVKKHCLKGKTPLAGNSIHVDRMFLSRYMPRLHEYLHYRNVDVSTIKELAGRWYPEIYAQRPKKTGEHRALGDIRDSVEELRFYKKEIFRE